MSERIIVLTERDVKETPSKVIDLLANLARRVTELERKLDSAYRRIDVLHNYVDSLISDATKFDRLFGDTEEKLEMILDDIVTLDERTQPLLAIIKAVKDDG